MIRTVASTKDDSEFQTKDSYFISTVSGKKAKGSTNFASM